MQKYSKNLVFLLSHFFSLLVLLLLFMWLYNVWWFDGVRTFRIVFYKYTLHTREFWDWKGLRGSVGKSFLSPWCHIHPQTLPSHTQWQLELMTMARLELFLPSGQRHLAQEVQGRHWDPACHCLTLGTWPLLDSVSLYHWPYLWLPTIHHLRNHFMSTFSQVILFMPPLVAP